MISGTTRLYGIIGHPIGHVRVPTTFNERFARDGIDAVSLPFDAQPQHFTAAIRGLQALENLGGFVVTAPHKQAMVALCDEVVGEARLVGAVNTVRRDADGRLIGELFDGSGFVRGLLAHGHDPAGKNAFLYGAGGAGNAVGFALARAGVAALTIHNRTTSRADDLAARIQQAYPACKVQVGAKDARGFDIAANATSVGLHDDELSFDVSALGPETLVTEVIMKPERTALINAAAARGCPTQQGRYMLDYQMDLMFDFMRIQAPPQKRAAMTYVVTDACIRCKYTDCVSVCPVDCFREGANMLVIDPDECIDCAVCVPECPVNAILADDEPGAEKWLALNAEHAKRWPEITRQIPPPADADTWKDLPDKLAQLDPAPASR